MRRARSSQPRPDSDNPSSASCILLLVHRNLGLLSVFGIAIAVLLLSGCGGGEGGGGRPNILLIITDDQRYGTIGEYMPETQARIFDQGVTFDRAFATTPLCCPSRASILTGMYAHKTGVHNNPDPLTETTLFERLHESGYYTGLVGKYLNSWNMNQVRPEFDSWVATQPGSSEYYNPNINDNGTPKEPPYYITEVERNYALTFLDDAAKQDKPFAMMLAFAAPHEPAVPRIGDEVLYVDEPPYRPESYNEEDISDKPAWLQKHEPLNERAQRNIDNLRLHQLQSLKHVDRTIAAVMDKLEAQGELDNTLVIFLSDNGLFWGEHRLTGKVYAYEEAIHVPMAIRYPKLASEGRIEDSIVANIDLAPTIYELAGIETPANVDGLSLVPLLEGGTIDRADILIEGWPGEGHFAGLRTERYIYIETYRDIPELYDLQDDPAQMTNLADDPSFADLIEQMRTRLHELEGQAPADDRTDIPTVLTTP